MSEKQKSPTYSKTSIKDKKNSIENWLEIKAPKTWAVVSFILYWRLIAVVCIVFFYVKSEKDNTSLKAKDDQMSRLSIEKNNLLSQISNAAKVMDEMPTAWWKKEFFPVSGEIIMMTYNSAFYEVFMKPLGLRRYDYVLKRDRDFFPLEQALVFETEELALYQKWLEQPIDEFGNRPALYANYKNVWVDLQGRKQADGYYRGVTSFEGHIYFYGGTKEPKESERRKIIKMVFIKPPSTKLKDILKSPSL